MPARQTAKKTAAAPPKPAPTPEPPDETPTPPPPDQAPETDPKDQPPQADPDPEGDGADDEPEHDQDEEPTEMERAYVAALQREREGYARYGRDDRCKDVEAELKRLGAPLERAVTHPPEKA
ncbi:hypothetical protein [Streptomyces sp. NPDC096153]|uniref:hypothetical protein n=1 Tax=Streptomyces sp. NPDC096153 TaxID=3155548 RepID=UPI00332E6DEC